MTAVQRCLILTLSLLVLGPTASANPPAASYIFPAGGQRGTTVKVRVGGLFLHQRCGFEMIGSGVEASNTLRRTKTFWLEGPLLPLPDSQQAEDYPQDMAGEIKISPDAISGVRHWRLWTSQGATPARMFVVGDLPEIVEDEVEGDPVPVEVKLPVTINGRIFPREDLDVWSFFARKGQSISCEVHAARLGSPLDAWLEILDPQGRRIAENDDTYGADSFVRFTAPADGMYQVRIHDIRFQGGQAYVYRLTLTAGPHVERVFPLGGRRGDPVKLLLAGQGVPSKPVAVPLPADAPQTYACPVTVGGELSNPVLLDLDDLPEYVRYPLDSRDHLRRIAVPAVCNGTLDRPGESDRWDFDAKKGDVFDIELRAARLGSPLAGVLRIIDSPGKEVARAESAAADPSLRFAVPADGRYQIHVADRFSSRGGPAFTYRLRIAPPAPPGFRLHVAADAVTVPRGGQAKFRVTAERIGNFADPVTLEVDGLPPGVSVTPTTIAAKQPAADLTFKAEATAPIRVARLTVRGSAKVGERAVTRTATLSTPRGVPEVDSVLLAVAMPTPFKIVGEYDMRWAPRGTTHERRYQLERNGYDGPVEVRLADRQARHLQGVTGPTVTVPPGASEFRYAIHLPPWMETGRTCRVCVMGTGVVRDADGSEHPVSFSSTAQNEQVVAVIEPGRLGLEVNPASLTAAPGQSASVAVQLARGKGLDGPATVEAILPAHWRGVTAEPTSIKAGRNSAMIRLNFADNPARLPNGPVALRATVLENGRPVVAEAKVQLRWER